jgi:transposase-like protein
MERELTIADLGLSLKELQGQPLELFAREGARILLTAGLEAEVTEFLSRSRYQRSQGELRGYRNGHRERRVKCAAGEIAVASPRVADTVEAFRSQLLGAWERHSRAVEEILPLLYVEGLSTRDFRRALKPLWGESGLSRSSISRANQALKVSFENWRRRDLSEEDILYLFLDGIYLGVRTGTREKEALLIAHGINRQGKRVMLHLSLGGRESTASWKGVVHDLVGRGLRPPKLIISDGNPGLLRAIKDSWPEVPRQRCTVHRIWNVLARVPRKRQEEIKKALRRVFYAACLEDAQAEAKNFLGRYGREFPIACEVLSQHLGECLTFYRFPQRHWKNIRTANVLERAFKEVRRRTNVIGRFPGEKAALAVVFGVLEEERLKWQGVRMKAKDIAWIEEAVKTLEDHPEEMKGLEVLAGQVTRVRIWPGISTTIGTQPNGDQAGSPSLAG